MGRARRRRGRTRRLHDVTSHAKAANARPGIKEHSIVRVLATRQRRGVQILPRTHRIIMLFPVSGGRAPLLLRFAAHASARHLLEIERVSVDRATIRTFIIVVIRVLLLGEGSRATISQNIALIVMFTALSILLRRGPG